MILQFDALLREAGDAVQPRHVVVVGAHELREDLLAVVAVDEVGDAPRRLEGLGNKRIHPRLFLLPHGGGEGRQLVVGDLQVILVGDDLREARAGKPLHDDDGVLIALFDAGDLAHRADFVQVFNGRLVRFRLALQHGDDLAVPLGGGLERGQGGAPPHLDGDEKLRENERIAQRQDGKCVQGGHQLALTSLIWVLWRRISMARRDQRLLDL